MSSLIEIAVTCQHGKAEYLPNHVYYATGKATLPQRQKPLDPA